MLHIKALAKRGPSGEPIATPSVCSYSWPLKVKSWSFIAALRRLTRSSLLRLRWYVSLNQLLMKALSASSSMVSSKGTLVNREETS